MFRIDEARMLVLFSPDDRDLALAWIDMCGCDVVCWNSHRTADRVLPIIWGGSDVTNRQRDGARVAPPRQIEPGSYAYRIRQRRRDCPRELLALVRAEPLRTTGYYADKAGIPRSQAPSFFMWMKRRGQIESVGGGWRSRDVEAGPIGFDSEAAPSERL